MADEIKMSIDVMKLTPDGTLPTIMNFLWGAKKVNRARLFASNDSVGEIDTYLMLCEVPRCVAMQMATHRKKHRCQFWMASARPDIDQKLAEGYSRMQPVRFAMLFTARGIIEISHYRLCNKAEVYTRMFMKLLREKLQDLEPGLARQMMPMCAFRNGLCTEVRSCGNPQQYKDWTDGEGGKGVA